MKVRTLTLFLGFAALVVLGATNAGAACAPGQSFSQWDAQTAAFYYSYPGADANTNFGTNGLVGHFWQTGAYASANDGGVCATSSWFKPYGGKWYINGLNGGEGCSELTTGCPTGQMVAMVDTTTLDGTGAKFAIGNATQCFSCGANYYFYSSSWTFRPIPRPRISVANKVGNVVSLNMNFDDVANAFFGPTGTPTSIITGYRLMRAFGTADPGRLPGAYTLVQTLPYAGSAPTITGFAQDCSLAGAGNDVFYGVQMQFDSPAVNGDYVGATTRLKCNSTLANPGQFNPIDKKPKKHA
jgi:hypothetical protein